MKKLLLLLFSILIAIQSFGQGNVKDGKKVGKWTSWYENGLKWTDRNYKDGKEDGKSTEWFANGQIKTEGNYKDGKQDN